MIKLISLLLGILLWGPLFSSGYAADMDQAAVFEKSAPSVVLVWAAREDGVGSKGTGSIIHEKGLVLTNAHVILDKSTEKPFARIAVILFPDNINEQVPAQQYRGYPSQLVAFHKEWDLALLQIDGLEGVLPALPFGNAQAVKIGEPVVAIGHPEQGALWTLTSGTISAKIENFADREGWSIFQTDTSINRGNSGGPLLNRDGHLVGINVSTARIAEDGFPITAINFAIQSTVAHKWLTSNGVSVALAKSSPKASKSVEAVPAETGRQETIQAGDTGDDRGQRLRDLMQQKRDKLRSLRR